MRVIQCAITAFFVCLIMGAPALAEEATRTMTGEEAYDHLSGLARAGGAEAGVFGELATTARGLDFGSGETVAFAGNLRRFDIPAAEGREAMVFYLVRAESAEVYVLAMPSDSDNAAYAGIGDVVGKKTSIEGRTVRRAVGGVEYNFIEFTSKPERLLLDRLFFIAIIILLFLTMVGMGLTLTIADFGRVFKKPMGMIIGPICQFGLLPLLAAGIGILAGYREAYPYIFLGLILIAASPGGVTSNLMTYLGKGDVALSVSLTAVCTVLALIFTPLLLTVYSSDIPDFSIPVMEVVKPMAILVIVPLMVGMLIRWKAENFAKRSEKIFALIGVFSLLFLIVVGILANLDKFADTERYGVKFYAVTFVLTFAGMVVAALLAKVLRISNFQVRAISIECGLRNASLAMTIAILLQDQMGDFYSSMLFTSGIFGLWMYAAGAITIKLFPLWLPVTEADLAELEKQKAGGKAEAPKKGEASKAEKAEKAEKKDD